MEVAIFGATGRTGSLLVSRARRSGYGVVAFARDPSKAAGLGQGEEGSGGDSSTPTGIRVVAGDVLDPVSVAGAVRGVGAVLVALGHTRTSTEDVHAEGTKNIVGAMHEAGVGRLISLTGAGVPDPEDRPKISDRAITGVLKLLQRSVLEDARVHAEIIRESGLDWTIVRAPRLTDGPATGNYRVGPVGRESGSRISRADVAEFMVRQIEDSTYAHQAPMISY